MERTCIKRGLSSFPLAVTPFQEVFGKECRELTFDTDVLGFFCELQKELMIDMTVGTTAITRKRRTEDVAAEDLVRYLSIKWGKDPLLLFEDFYEVHETTKKPDLSIPIDPLPKRRRRRRSPNTIKAISAARKLAAEKLKELKKEAHKRTLDICRAVVFKTPFPPPLKKVELKVETLTYTDIMCRPDIIEFFGKQRRMYSFSSIPGPSLVPQIYKSKPKDLKKNPKKAKSELKSKSEFKASTLMSNPKAEKKISKKSKLKSKSECKASTLISNPKAEKKISKKSKLKAKLKSKSEFKASTLKSNLKAKKKNSKKSGSELKAERPPSIDLMSRPDIIEFFGNKRKVYSFNIPEPYPVSPTYEYDKEAEEAIESVFFENQRKVCRFRPTNKSNPKGEKRTSICEHSIIVPPSKESVEFQTRPDLSVSIHGTSDAASRQSVEDHTYTTKSKVEEKSSTCDHTKKVVRFREMTEPSIEMSPGSDLLVTRLPGFKHKQEISRVDAVLKQSHEAPKCKPNSKVDLKTALCENLMKISQFKEKMEQIFKIPETKEKQLAGIKCGTSVETSEVDRQPSIDVPHPDSQVPKIPRKKRKQEVSDVNDVPTESREEARKKLAIILLRIAGKY